MDKQELILSAALRLFVADGFHGTPTSKIAKEAGVANGTLFHHYKTKEDLIIALYNRIKNELAGGMSQINKRDDFVTIKFRNLFTHSVHWALNNKSKFYYIQQFNFSPHLGKVPQDTLNQQSSAYQELIAEAVRKKLIKQLPANMIMALFNGQVYGVYQYLTSAEFEPTERDRTIHYSYEMLWDMLKYM